MYFVHRMSKDKGTKGSTVYFLIIYYKTFEEYENTQRNEDG